MDPQVKKQVLRRLSYGLYVLGAADGDDMAAGTVNWLSQAAFAPPLVMVGVKADSHLHALITRARAFAVSILGAGQQSIASDFFRPSQVEAGRINRHPFERGPATGAPVFPELPAWFEARVTDVVARGDHSIVVGEVVEAGLRDGEAKPLEMSTTGWFYGG